MNDRYNYLRVHRTNLIVIIFVVTFFLVKSVVAGGIALLTQDMMYTLPIVIVAAIIYFLPIKDTVKGFLLGIIPTFAAFALLVVDGFDIEKYFILFTSITMIALYFNVRVIMAYGVVLNLLFISFYLFLNTYIDGELISLNSFLGYIIILNGALVLLFFLCRWGNEMVLIAAKKENEANNALNRLETTFNKITDSTIVINNNIDTIQQTTQETETSSDRLIETVQEIAQGIQSQAESVGEINNKVSNITSEIELTKRISEELMSSSKAMVEEVTRGENKVANMSSQMDTIHMTMKSSKKTVSTLEESMSDVNNFLEVISAISARTNLLALNAAIESARAGEMGKGFAVVADEVRKLAEQSAKSVEDINIIIEKVTKQATEAVAKVDEGEHALVQGMEILEEAVSQYGDIRKTFMASNESLSEELNMINKVDIEILVIHNEIDNIASISEQQSAASEEILATIENQHSGIIGMNKGIGEIGNLANELDKLVNE